MFVQRFVTQPAASSRYLELFSDALAAAAPIQFDAAVAYASILGVEALEGALGATWAHWPKRWLVAFDWCRSEPWALRRLLSFTNSAVRIHDGADVVRRAGCFPTVPFHPKTFILQGPGLVAVITGSGNLSRNGLTRGYEHGSLLLVSGAATPVEEQLRANCQVVADWFETAWAGATRLTSRLLQQYDARFNEQRAAPVPIDEDVAVGRGPIVRPTFAPDRLKMLRVCNHMWINAGRLHLNLGPGRPGNQLMMSPMTRVFFRFSPRNVPRDTRIGTVRVAHDGFLGAKSLRYSNNAMDVLSLPVPRTEGPDRYDDRVLLFERVVDDRGLKFVLSLPTAAQVRSCQRKSAQIGANYRMSSGREWGLF